MQIQLTIQDDVGITFISASRWALPNRTDLTDAQLIKKYIKKQIGSLIDDYKQDQAITEYNLLTKTIRNELEEKQQQYINAERLYADKVAAYLNDRQTTDLGD